MTPDLATARRIIQALITHQYPHDLFEIRRQVANDYGTMPDAEELAAQQMEAYCTQDIAMAERKLWAETIEEAKAFLAEAAAPVASREPYSPGDKISRSGQEYIVVEDLIGILVVRFEDSHLTGRMEVDPEGFTLVAKAPQASATEKPAWLTVAESLSGVIGDRPLHEAFDDIKQWKDKHYKSYEWSKDEPHGIP